MSLPAISATIVAWAVLGSSPERIEIVRVLGGPTRAGASASVLVSAWALGDGRRVPIPGLGVRLIAGAAPDARASGVTDASGHLEAQLLLPPSPRPARLRVERADDGALLAEGEIGLDSERWRVGARSEGGWLPGHASGELRLELALAEGALAVPFEGHLLARLREAAEPGVAIAGARLEIELQGAELLAAPSPTDASGRVELALRPLEHGVRARVIARSGTRSAEWSGVLPVIPGALSARLDGDTLRVVSPIERPRAFVSLISQHERLGGAVVELSPEPDGTASGSVEPGAALLARLRAEPTWAVVSSEDDKRSPAVVGWPLGAARGSEPASTFAVADLPLLDGEPGALYDLARRQRGRRRAASALLAALALLAAALFWAEVREHGRRPAWGAARHGWFLAAAVACIALGLGALAYFGALAR